MKFYNVTIQMKILRLYFHMMPFVSQNFRKVKFGTLVEICLWPHLAVKVLRVEQSLLSKIACGCVCFLAKHPLRGHNQSLLKMITLLKVTRCFLI